MTNLSIIPFKTWLLLLAVGILMFLMNIDYTAVNLTLAPISQELGSDLNTLQWLLSGYVLIWGAFVIPAGRIADIYGRRNTLITGLIIFMFGSAVVGIGHNVTMLIAGRVIQGFGAAIFTAPCWAIIFTTAPKDKQGLVMGIMMLFSSAGLAIGPTLGGYIIEAWEWRWIYYINLPIGMVIIGILLSVVKNERENDAISIDFIGSCLLASGLCLLVFCINQVEIWSISSPKLWLTLAVSLGILFAFFARDGKLTNPMLPHYVLRNKAFMSCAISCSLMSMVFSAVIVLIGLYLQNAKEFSSYKTGIVFFAMTVSMGALSPFGGSLVDRFGVRTPMIFTTIFAAIGVGIAAFFDTGTDLYIIITALFLTGIGIGGFFTAGNIAMMRSVQSQDINISSAVYTMAMMLGNTISVILSTSLLVLFGRDKIVDKLNAQGIEAGTDITAFLFEAIARPAPNLEQMQKAFPEQATTLFHILKSSFVESFSMNMLGVTGLAILALLTVVRGIKD
ncbi:MAG: MFS transporter [Pseudomonadota bacterium]